MIKFHYPQNKLTNQSSVIFNGNNNEHRNGNEKSGEWLSSIYNVYNMSGTIVLYLQPQAFYKDTISLP